MIKMFPRNDEEARRVPKDLPGVPLVYVTSPGNRRGWAVLSAPQAESYGYKVIYDSIGTTIATAMALKSYFESVVKTGSNGFQGDVTGIRDYFEKALGLERLYEIEAKTSKRILAQQGKKTADDKADAVR
jgi:hypothetical protein